MTIQVLTANVETDGSGDFTVTLPASNGMLKQVRYIVDGGSPLATGADITLSETGAGVGLLTMANIGTSSFTRYPRAFVANPADGVVSSTNVAEMAVHQSLTFTVAQGGASNLGVFLIYIEEL